MLPSCMGNNGQHRPNTWHKFPGVKSIQERALVAILHNTKNQAQIKKSVTTNITHAHCFSQPSVLMNPDSLQQVENQLITFSLAQLLHLLQPLLMFLLSVETRMEMHQAIPPATLALWAPQTMLPNKW